jgi:acylphosphatase
MMQCLRITFPHNDSTDFLHTFIQKNARSLEIEGTAQLVANHIKIVACGTKDAIDAFLDFLHKEAAKKSIDLEIEPFLKDKDYRGVFRIIE